MSNFTFTQLPGDITDTRQLRRFLSKLLLELDTAFGNRGNASFTFSKDFVATAKDINITLNNLQIAISDTNTALDNLSAVVNTLPTKDYLSINYEPIIPTKGTAFNKDFGNTAGTVTEGGTTTNNPKQPAIAALAQTISDPPTQVEVQAISDKIDAILAALTNANII